AACGLGYGSAALAENPEVRVIGMDASDYAVDYAKLNFCPDRKNLEFRAGDVCDLSWLGDGSVDLVVSFETVEHLKEPERFLVEVRRILKPGGVFLGSVPNMWLDETGKDPNPWHFHVFDFAKFASLCGEFFLLQDVFRQTAGGGMKLPNAPRRLRRVNLPVTSEHDRAEWWLIAAAKPITMKLSVKPEPQYLAVLAPDPQHPLYSSWLPHSDLPVKYYSNPDSSFEIPDDTAILVTHDNYYEPSRSIIRKAVEKNIPTLILADGILEYRNTFEHPGLVPGAILQPVLGHKIAALGRSQVRFLDSWGNEGKSELVGSPRFDVFAKLQKRQRPANEPFRVLVTTALTPYFTEEQHVAVSDSLKDLKRFFETRRNICGVAIEPVWRLTKGLEAELGIPVRGDVLSKNLLELLQEVDAVISTPSTCLLEAMQLGLPTAVLDYCNTPHYVQPAWRITAESQMADVVTELINPPEPKMLFQETTLHDSLE
ncbi:MAG: class I SAM-dependent methyltransferase, partial [Limisphaerales bacterium]